MPPLWQTEQFWPRQEPLRLAAKLIRGEVVEAGTRLRPLQVEGLHFRRARNPLEYRGASVQPGKINTAKIAGLSVARANRAVLPTRSRRQPEGSRRHDQRPGGRALSTYWSGRALFP